MIVPRSSVLTCLNIFLQLLQVSSPHCRISSSVISSVEPSWCCFAEALDVVCKLRSAASVEARDVLFASFDRRPVRDDDADEGRLPTLLDETIEAGESRLRFDGFFSSKYHFTKRLRQSALLPCPCRAR